MNGRYAHGLHLGDNQVTTFFKVFWTVTFVIMAIAVGFAVLAAIDQLQIEEQQRLRNEACTHVLQCVDTGGERDACATHFPGCEDRGRELSEPEEQ